MLETPDSVPANSLSTALVVPDETRRLSLKTALRRSDITITREFRGYPSRNDLTHNGRTDCDVVIVDLDDNVEQAMRAIENIAACCVSTTVMACSSRSDSALMQRSMQAGAREFLIQPLLPQTVRDAFARVLARRPNGNKAPGKVMVFLPSKGGVGVTTIATNFALSLAKESGVKVVVVDMDIQLGEIALSLGMTAAFSVVDALQNPARLDKDFLSTLLLRHSSGLAVLGAAEQYNTFDAPVEGAGRLFDILREEFNYVVVDAGTCHSHIQKTLFEIAETIYLVTELTLPALRNSHRLISFLSLKDGSRKLEVILNRFNSRHLDIDENSATKALGRPISWRIPNFYSAVRIAQDSGVPLAMGDSPITRAVSQMAKAACGKPLTIEKATKRFSFFGAKVLPRPVET